MATITYTRPAMSYWSFCAELLKVPHLLIAGSTCSGKSVLINSMIYTAMGTSTPASCEFVLIDPKKMELYEYADLPFTIAYCDEASTALAALDNVINTMFRRCEQARQQHMKEYNGSHIYVIIDEYADLAITAKRAFQERVTRIAQLGRAARIHLIIATQRPTSDTINGAIKTNMDYRIALHTAEAQHSRNIIGMRGAEDLQIGQGLYYTPQGVSLQAIPMTSAEDLTGRCEWWRRNPGVIQRDNDPCKKKRRFLRR